MVHKKLPKSDHYLITYADTTKSTHSMDQPVRYVLSFLYNVACR
uniref:Uncharacterized protein n=1 Tax=Arundo donax TaxID=35708 RepID=A0A0A9BG02_ARUDO